VSRSFNISEVRRRLREVFAQQFRVPAWLDDRRRNAPEPERRGWIERADELEAHARLHLIDGVLQTLGWSVTPNVDVFERFTQNMSIELSLRPPDAVYAKRLDYFGFDSQTRASLLAVESKGPDLVMPASGAPLSPTDHPWISELLAVARSNGGLRTPVTHLSGSWVKDVHQLADYVRRIVRTPGTTMPRRALLTNGTWYVVFAEPAVMLPGAQRKEGPDIYVFDSQDAVLRHLPTFCELLAYSSLALPLPTIPSGAIRSHIDPTRIHRTANAIHLFHARHPRANHQVPYMEVKPLLLLIDTEGRVCAVHGSSVHRPVPVNKDELGLHLQQMADDTAALRQEVSAFLAAQLPPASPMVDLFRDGRSLLTWQAVSLCLEPTDPPGERFHVLTGESTHFLVSPGTFAGCDGHAFGRLLTRTKAALQSPVLASSLTPRSFFTDDQPHHCQHTDINASRRAVLADPTQQAGDLAYVPVGDPVCFMLPIDEYLCCRGCAFQAVCVNSPTFSGVATAVCQRTPLTVGGQGLAPVAASVAVT
jgi:hypothetical protein